MKHLLTIAGSDCSGGAGIQADLKTFAALGVFGMSVITAVTVQNTVAVRASQDILPDIIAGQMDAVFEDIRVDGVKIGMVSCVETIRVLADRLVRHAPPLVVLDTVMVSKSGYRLLSEDAVDALVEQLVPKATMITPNIPEAEWITGHAIRDTPDMEKAAVRLYEKGAPLVLIKGGHRAADATDILFDGRRFHQFPGEKIETRHTHGTGCTLSAAIAALMARGASPAEAVAEAKAYVTTCIRHAPAIGNGAGPLHHFFPLYEKAKISFE